MTGDWASDIFEAFQAEGISQVGFVPDAGLTGLIARCERDPEMEAVTLTSEQEGVALAAGAWLGGARAVLLMQSSGLGNCVNMLGLTRICRFPLLALVTMRGEWGEFNPWQNHMGGLARPLVELCGGRAYRLDTGQEAGEPLRAAARLAFEGNAFVTVLVSQRLIGAKTFGH